MKLLRTLRICALFMTLIVVLIPVTASAATTVSTTPEKPVCLMVSTALKNGQLVLLWASVNATTVRDDTNASTTSFGFRFIAPQQTTSYTYSFTGAGGTTQCTTSVAVAATAGAITPPAPGAVTVITTTTTAPATGTGPLSVSMLPLLSGGSTAAGASIPVAYIVVSNKGTAAASIKGFTLTDRGTAIADSDVIGFSTSDDKGGSRATIGGPEGTRAVTAESAFVPLATDLAPGQTRIFTIKALLSAKQHEAGKTLIFDVTSVDSTAAVSGSFPLRGVTWTLTS